MRWLFTGKGMLTYSPSIVAASVKVLEGSATPDVQVTFCTGQLQGRPDRRARGDAGPQRRRLADAAPVARLCRGQVETGPATPRLINPRYLSEESDRRAIIGGLRLARRMFRRTGTAAIRPRRDPTRRPKSRTDDELLDYARRKRRHLLSTPAAPA